MFQINVPLQTDSGIDEVWWFALVEIAIDCWQ